MQQIIEPQTIVERFKYPIKELRVGDSFFVDNKSERDYLHSAVKIYNNKRGRKDWIGIKTKAEGEGLRVTRVY